MKRRDRKRSLPPPLVPPHVDLRDVPVPRHLFASMMAELRGIPLAEARAFVDEVVDGMEAERRVRRMGDAHGSA